MVNKVLVRIKSILKYIEGLLNRTLLIATTIFPEFVLEVDFGDDGGALVLVELILLAG